LTEGGGERPSRPEKRGMIPEAKRKPLGKKKRTLNLGQRFSLGETKGKPSTHERWGKEGVRTIHSESRKKTGGQSLRQLVKKGNSQN